jgi:hypothetical protein
MKKPARIIPDGLFFSPAGKRLLGQRLQVHCRIFAAAVDFDVEFEPVAFIDRGQAGAFHRRDMDESIGLPIIAADEAEALHRIEEFDGALGLLAGQLALRSATEATGGAAALTRSGRTDDFHRLTLDLEGSR